MTKTFKLYSDSSHSWLAVKTKLLSELNLTNELSSSSYIKGKTAYLEEDSDLPKFKTAYEAKYGAFSTVTVDHGDRSWVRNMKSYSDRNTVLTNVELPVTDDAGLAAIEGVKHLIWKSEFQE